MALYLVVLLIVVYQLVTALVAEVTGLPLAVVLLQLLSAHELALSICMPRGRHNPRAMPWCAQPLQPGRAGWDCVPRAHLLRCSWGILLRQVHPPSVGTQRGLMAGVLLVLALVVLTPIGSGGLRSRPAHHADVRPPRNGHRWDPSDAAQMLTSPKVCAVRSGGAGLFFPGSCRSCF